MHLLCQVDVQDTVGCGDSFAAAVVLGYTRRHAIPPVMALANAVRVLASQSQIGKARCMRNSSDNLLVLAMHVHAAKRGERASRGAMSALAAAVTGQWRCMQSRSRREGSCMPPWQVGAATAMGQGAGRNVASTATVLSLLEREAASGPHMAWVSWDDVDAQDTQGGPALEGTLRHMPTSVSGPASAEGRPGDGAGAAAPAGDGARDFSAGRSSSSGGSQAAQSAADAAAVETHAQALGHHGSDRGSAAREAIALLQESLLRCGRA